MLELAVKKTVKKSPPVPMRRKLRERRDLGELLGLGDDIAETSESLMAAHLQYALPGGVRGLLPRYLFTGPGSKGNYLRVGVFAGIHGDEISGVSAAMMLLCQLESRPELATGYELFVYPVCNPTGYEDDTRWSRSGRDLNREFWRNSSEPEVIILEKQLRNLNFDGIISLHSDDTSEGLYGFVRGHSLTRHVLEPALEKAGEILPRNIAKEIDSFAAVNGIIESGYTGILAAPAEQHPQPFQIVFETPQLASLDLQVMAHCLAVEEILSRFRVMIAQAQNI